MLFDLKTGAWLITMDDEIKVPCDVARCPDCDDGLIVTVLEAEESDASGLMLATLPALFTSGGRREGVKPSHCLRDSHR